MEMQWNKKDTQRMTLVLLVIFLAASLYVVDWRFLFYNTANMGKTTGAIVNMEETNMTTQTQLGSRTRTVQYVIQCSYTVDSINYIEKISIPSNSRINELLITIGYPQNNIVEIWYEKNNPSKFLINTNYNSGFYKEEN
ncbi:MAG: hypothetical protein LBR81_09620 [Prevotellaceae bacterium]|jgi:hypothetical protein|nr:hypothetical protein [Prevotellaceae bacterium]